MPTLEILQKLVQSIDQPVLSKHTASQISYMVDDEVDSIFPLMLKIPTSSQFQTTVLSLSVPTGII